MKFGKKAIEVLITSVLLSSLLGIRVSVCEPQSNSSDKVEPLIIDRLFFGQNTTYQLSGSRIVARFTPKNGLGEGISIQKLASDLGYDRLSWTNYVVEDPHGISDRRGQRLDTPYNDPPEGGYLYDPADRLPFYWDLEQCWQCKSRHHWQHQNNLKQFELVFEDFPADYRLQPEERIEFVTSLVGIKEYDSQTQTATWEILHTFRWHLTNPDRDLSLVSLTESDVALNKLSPQLLEKMQVDGAILTPFSLE